MMSVKAWTEKIVIPTYETGKPDKNPMFFEKRVYQGSSGVVYPNPIIDKIHDEKTDKEYEGVFLENQYLKILILPELGGRIQMAYDKIKQRHFIYYNQVIKPALVGLCGPWISGGIEFNWPQHHRPSTYEPVEYTIKENEDGSKTVWVNELEKMFHTKGTAGFTLHPDRAYLEINAKLSNPTDTPQTFLWWANPAVKVHDDYQSVFPPDVNAVFDHGKRDVSDFPIATGTYYKVGYSPGTDISKYKNIPVPTSYMAINSKYNFVGGYENDIEAGMLHVADHHISPGKKQWTWGNGDFGKAWDRNLTDEDGPYIELMAGVFTDNQPDFTWLKPYEEKTFTQYFLPYRELGLVKNASKDLLLNLEEVNGELVLKIFATSKQQVLVKLTQADVLFFEEELTLDPLAVYKRNFPLEIGFKTDDFKVFIYNEACIEVLKYNPSDNADKELPQAAKPALMPEDVETVEQLFLTGQHLEQYRHATYRPMPYYLEGIKREPNDIRCNNAIGLWKFKKGLFEESLSYFKTAIGSITERNPNPYNCEPYFNNGLANLYLGRVDDAYNSFFKSAWDKSFQDAAYYHIAQIDLQRKAYENCLEHIDWALDRNARNGKAYLIKILCLKKLGKEKEARVVIEQALAKDMFNLAVLFEKYLWCKSANDEQNATIALAELAKLSGSTSHNAIEYAIDYIQAGYYEQAIEFIKLVAPTKLREPLLNYYLAYAFNKLKNEDAVAKHLWVAKDAYSSYCFPNRLFDILVLEHAIEANDKDAKARYYLGNLFYDKQQYDKAIELWEASASLDNSLATVFRNLGLAYYNKRNDGVKALEHYELAYSLDKNDSRIAMELDSLYKKLNRDAEFRLRFLADNSTAVLERDDLYLEQITIHNFLGNYQLAYDLLMARKFHPWEGGEGKVPEQYKTAIIGLAKKNIVEGKFEKAIEFLTAAQTYPDNLGEGKLVGTQENDIFYWLGNCYELLGDLVEAENYWKQAATGLSEPGMAMFYNDQQPDKIFYQGYALQKLGKPEKANAIFHKLIAYGEANLNEEVKLDYFAVSLPDLLIFEGDLSERSTIHCLYLSALGYLGLGEVAKATNLFNQILAKEALHYGAQLHSAMAQSVVLT